MVSNSVSFQTTDSLVQAVYNAAEDKARHNLVQFAGRRVLIEGGEYPNLWLETQPMGGEMYAKRDPEAAYNNIDLFMRAANSEGMMPGMISYIDGVYREHHNFIQGYCFPVHALNLYYLLNLDRDYLLRLYEALRRYDAWLWASRESDGDGCLEAWCPCDTGEDYASKFFGAPHFWESRNPPHSHEYHFPRASMDLMGYSYDGRRTLAQVSALLGNGEEAYWSAQAEEIKRKIRSYLWREERHACFDRDENGAWLEILTHNNLRVMYHGAFSQEMADDFIRYHLVNPEEFWTPMPLPSTAVNDPLFRNIPENNWSGQPEGLTYQRTIRALENYRHHAEIPLLGNHLLRAIGTEGFFSQQFDPFTGEISRKNNPTGDYGPTLLACLEYISRMYGVHRQFNEIWWGAYHGGHDCSYTQRYGETTCCIGQRGGQAEGFVNGVSVFRVSAGCRVETTLAGKVLRVTNISAGAQIQRLETEGKCISQLLEPNQALVRTASGDFAPDRSVPFTLPEPERA